MSINDPTSVRLRNTSVVDAESKRCPLTEWWEQLCVFPSFFWIEELTVENDTHSPLPFCYPGRNLLPLILRHSLLTDLFLIDSFPTMWIIPSYGEIHRKMSSFCHSVGRKTESIWLIIENKLQLCSRSYCHPRDGSRSCQVLRLVDRTGHFLVWQGPPVGSHFLTRESCSVGCASTIKLTLCTSPCCWHELTWMWLSATEHSHVWSITENDAWGKSV